MQLHYHSLGAEQNVWWLKKDMNHAAQCVMIIIWLVRQPGFSIVNGYCYNLIIIA